MVPQEIALYEELDAREHLRLWGGLYGLAGRDLAAAVDRVLEQVGLAGRARDPVKEYSGGMKRRLNLGLGLVHSPRIVLLDEPTVGIDPQARLNILEVVREVAGGGTTVLYTTHYLEEAEKLCDRIAIIDHGKILAEGSLDELQRMVGGEEVVTLRGDFDAEALVERLLADGGVRVLAREPGRLVLATAEPRIGRGSMKLLSTLFAEGVAMEGGGDRAAEPQQPLPQAHRPGAARLMSGRRRRAGAPRRTACCCSSARICCGAGARRSGCWR